MCPFVLNHVGPIPSLRRASPVVLGLASLALLLTSWGCDDHGRGARNEAGSEAGSEAGHGAGGAAGEVPPQGFDDHTVRQLETVARFEEHSVDDGESGSIVKFFLSGFQPDEAPELRFLDGRFYSLHDEVYWMRLLNGRYVWGFEHIEPVRGLSLPTVESAYSWTRQQLERGLTLPLDLTITSGGRLYSPYFYRVALSRPRHIALGTILHIPARAGRVRPEELWAFELEYSDDPTPEEVASISARLRAALPPEAGELLWLTRSPQQDETADHMERERLPEWDHVLRYHELTTPGEVRVYSEGLTAGRLYVIHAGEERPPLRSERSILLFDHVPDELPPTQGLITTVPQTPLAHINLLAQNRGIPNLYVSGLISNPMVSQFQAFRPGVILWAQAPDEWRLEVLSDQEYSAYEQLLSPAERSLPAVELSSQPLTYSLEELSLSLSLTLRGVLGGKAAGLVACLEAEGATPYRPLVITGRAYEEHLSPWRERLEGLLSHYAFADERLRTLCLEGPLGLASRFPSAADQAMAVEWIEMLRGDRGADDPVVWWAAQGGVQRVIRDTPIAPETFEALLLSLREHFEALSPQQGLRFRSSSNVEDLEGFNGAGLYSSETGYLYPQAQEGSRRSKTVAWALREVWASYWGVEAVQERQREGIPHLDGHMSALVHPHFQDELELANGVVILTLTPPPSDQLPEVSAGPSAGEGARVVATVLINSQAGALSVTNPERPGALPEVIEVTISAPEEGAAELGWPYTGLARPYSEWLDRLEVRVTRLQGSTERGEVLSEEQARELAARSLEASARWLSEERRRSLSAQAPRFLILDLEFRVVDASWPLARRAPTEVGGGLDRVVLKQARPLEPWSRGLGAELLALDVPRDLLRRARRIERVSCELTLPAELGGGLATLSAHQLYTSPLARPSLGYEERPFTVELSARGWPQQGEGETWSATYEQVSLTSGAQGAPWTLRVTPKLDAGAPPSPFAHLSLVADGADEVEFTWLNAGAQTIWTGRGTCERAPLFAEPSEYLRAILESRGARE